MSEKTKQQLVVEEFERNGFTQEHVFPGEYVFMREMKWNTVRVYNNGDVWVKHSTTGFYRKREELNNG